MEYSSFAKQDCDHSQDIGLTCIALCAAGEFIDYDSGKLDACTLCPAGSYKDDTGDQACTACDEGFTTTDAGAMSADACVAELLYPDVVADIIFIIDDSKTVPETEFQGQVRFIQAVVSLFGLGADKVQIGVYGLAVGHQAFMNLGQFGSKEEIVGALGSAQKTGEWPSIPTALSALRTSWFINYGRTGVQQVAVLFFSSFPVYITNEPQAVYGEIVPLRDIKFRLMGGIVRLQTPSPALMSFYRQIFNRFFWEVKGNWNAANLEKITLAKTLFEFASEEVNAAELFVKFDPSAIDVKFDSVKADIIFMIDDSDSVSEDDFQNQLRFVITIIAQFGLGDSGVQVGVYGIAGGQQVSYVLFLLTSLFYELGR